MDNTELARSEVKARLLRTAAELWNLPGLAAGQVDPVLDLLFGAVSYEIERIGNAIFGSDARIFQQVAKYLLPEVSTLPEPAHGVVQLHPKRRMNVSRYEEISVERTVRRKQNMNRPETYELHFSFAGDIPLASSWVAERAMVDKLGVMEGMRWVEKTTLAEDLPPHVMMLGLQGEATSNEELWLYFDWPGNPSREQCLAVLHRISAYALDGTPLTVKAGLPELNPGTNDPPGGVDALLQQEQKVRGFYGGRFLRVALGELSEMQPPWMDHCAGEGNNGQPSRWIRLDFPVEIGPDLMREALVLDNCAPVINRRLEKGIYRLQPEMNLKRIDTQGAFLEMEKAENGQGQTYARVPSAEHVEGSLGTYVVRHGATARFDERDGRYLLQHVVDQMREEARAFAAMDIASTLSDIASMEQALSRIERRLRETPGGAPRTYVAIRPFAKAETAHLHYWVTDGETANGIPAGVLFKGRQQALAARRPVQLVSSTTGARGKRSPRELVQQYRAALMTRGRIITRRDIMEYCRMVCGGKLRTVEVKDAVMTSPSRNKGLVRCLEVSLSFTDSVAAQEATYFVERLQTELNTRSALSIPLRVR